MALANVAVHLAQSGRRVLLVDFDLEAPGLDTLDLPQPRTPSKGVVDFVQQYLASGESPDVSSYLYETEGAGKQGGKLWIMPAGLSDEDYSVRLGAIDWARLYSERDGYVLLEDLKAQWKELLAPDYVLIDSRTGHTDVAGICTRQLPEAVVVLFIPNEQNRRGLAKAVNDIRAEGKRPGGHSIALHFVMSNVPDLDDEEKILASRLRAFDAALGIGDDLLTVHRYDSLLLLNQAIFVRDRPRSRLAREYRAVANEIISQNPEDREGALRFIRSLDEEREHFSPQDLEARLERMRLLHSRDAEVLLALANARRRERRFHEARALLDDVVALGNKSPGVLLARAESRQLTQDSEGAVQDLSAALANPEADFPTVDRAVRLLRMISPENLAGLTSRPAVANRSASEQLWLATQLRSRRTELEASKQLALGVLSREGLSEHEHSMAVGPAAIALVALREFGAARELLRPLVESVAKPNVQHVFNYAIAEWGETGAPPTEGLRRVVELDVDQKDQAPDANYYQCLALAAVVIGERERALDLIARSRTSIRMRPGPEFSCWRYRLVSPEQFNRDLDAIERLARNGVGEPELLRRGAHTPEPS